MISLDSRLKTAAGLCRKGVIVADVGTDHALLACHLAMNGAKAVIASDIKDGPLDAARRTVEETGVTNVTVLKSDGLDAIDYADDVVICGMGGELIARIISGCRFLSGDTRFILQPMTKVEVLRRWLYANGFEIDEEQTAYDGKRGYVIIVTHYTGSMTEVDELFALTGKVNDPVFLRLVAQKLEKNARGMEKSGDFSESAKKLRGMADTILKKAEELA